MLRGFTQLLVAVASRLLGLVQNVTPWSLLMLMPWA